KELSRKASERLIRQALGDSVRRGTLDLLVTRAEGNAFYLEELIRAVAEGRGDALPETVVAMVQARLEGFDADARRVPRAASVFGSVCWQGGVEALLGSAVRATQTGDWLSMLAAREALLLRPESRFPGEREFAFRHALVREGAYATLTEQDRV